MTKTSAVLDSNFGNESKMCFDLRVVTCGPNEALIISGVFYGREPSMIVGGRALVIPCIQTIQKLPLSTITLVVNSPTVYTSQGVPISVTGVAQVWVKFILDFWHYIDSCCVSFNF